MNPPTKDAVFEALGQLDRWGGKVRIVVTLDGEPIAAGSGRAGLLRCLQTIITEAPDYARRKATDAELDAEEEAAARGYARRLGRGGVVR